MLGSYPPPYGGIATHVRGLVDALEEAGYAADVVAPGLADGLEAIGRHSAVHRVSKGVRDNLLRVSRYPVEFIAFLLEARISSPQVAKSYVVYQRARSVFEDRRESIKLISAYMLHPWGFAGAMLSEEFDRPLITTNFGELFQFRTFYLAHRSIVERVVRRSVALVASSRHCGSMYGKYLDMPDVSVEVVPYGVDRVFFDSSYGRQEARAREKLPQSGFLVLFLGRMHAEMGLDTWLKVVERLGPSDDPFHFVIAGAEGPLTAAARDLELRWPERVSVRVNVPFDSLPGYYLASNLVVAPSADERTCMGVTIKEAMASGRAVLASDIGGIGEAVVPGETGVLVQARDVAAFVDALRRLAEAPDSLDVMGRRGRERALQVFTTAATHARIIDIMRRAMDVRSPASV